MLRAAVASLVDGYCACLQARPYATQSVTSAVLWCALRGAYDFHSCSRAPILPRGAGDALAQRLESPAEGSGGQVPPAREPTAASPAVEQREGENRRGIDARRVGLVTCYGALFVGPLGHWWYEQLDRTVSHRFLAGSVRHIGAKIALDTVVFNPIHVSSWFGLMGALSGDSMAKISEQLRTKFWPTLIAESLVWPAVQWYNFLRVPVRHQLLVVNLFSLADCTALSWVKSQQELGLGKHLHHLEGGPFGP